MLILKEADLIGRLLFALQFYIIFNETEYLQNSKFYSYI